MIFKNLYYPQISQKHIIYVDFLSLPLSNMIRIKIYKPLYLNNNYEMLQNI